MHQCGDGLYYCVRFPIQRLSFLQKGCAVLLTKSESNARLRGYAWQNQYSIYFGEKFVSRLEAQWQFGH
jgi:hypothetical protein